MSLWCLRCRGSVRGDLDPGNEHRDCAWLRHCCIGMEKSWSGNLMSLPPYKHLRRESGVGCGGCPISPRKGRRKAYSISEPIVVGEESSNSEALKFARMGHRKAYSISEVVAMDGEEGCGMGEPRLVRSGGMRRDWSFEDLHKRVLARDR